VNAWPVVNGTVVVTNSMHNRAGSQTPSYDVSVPYGYARYARNCINVSRVRLADLFGALRLRAL